MIITINLSNVSNTLMSTKALKLIMRLTNIKPTKYNTIVNMIFN